MKNQLDKYETVKKMAIYQRLERFDENLKAACFAQNIYLNHSLNSHPINIKQSYAVLQANASLMPLFQRLLMILKVDGAIATVKFANQYAVAEEWIDLVAEYIEDETQPLNPLFYELMLVASKELGEHFRNEKKELGELDLGWALRNTYNLFVRDKIFKYYQLSVSYMQRYNKVLYEKSADILPLYAELEAKQQVFHDKLLAYSNTIGARTAETIEAALQCDEDITHLLEELVVDKFAVLRYGELSMEFSVCHQRAIKLKQK